MKRTPLARRTPLRASTPLRREKQGEGTTQRERPARNPLRRKSPLKKRSRSAAEFKRIYGSKARVEWVKSRPCVVRACTRFPSENAHVEGDGIGRKADADKIAPMCHGHHRLLHSWGVSTFQRVFGLDLNALAAQVEAAWQQEGGK